MATITGTNNNDTLNGGTDNDVIYGLDGADTLNGNGGNDTLYGGAGNDFLSGGAGNDFLIGEGGGDQMLGGAGDDAYFGVDITDLVTEFDGDGTDTIYVTASYNLSRTQSLEVLAMGDTNSTVSVTLNGNDFNNQVIGAAGNDTLGGGLAGNDTLYGLAGNDSLVGGSGSDYLIGGAGNDTYSVSGTDDFVIEAVGGGSADTVRPTAAYTLTTGSEIEFMIASGTGVGDAAFFGTALTGNEFANNITGGTGGDTIDGQAGADTMFGLGGSDVYYVDNIGDIVVENIGGGTDLIFTSTSYTLGTNVEIETLAIANAASTTAFTLVGNALTNQILAAAGNDSLNGEAGNDTLYGFGGNDTLNGGAGNDVLLGGTGNDIYYINDTGDVITEASASGADTAFTTVTYTLAAGAEVEILAHGNAAAGGALALTGNGLNNQILGGEGADTIDGWVGSDTLYGFGGNDVYYVGNIGDIVVEAAGAGLDTIFTESSYTLAGTSEVEILALANAASTSSFTLGGNEFNNQVLAGAGNDVLTGNAGNDTLWGFGGNDTLTGGLGNDVLVGGLGSDVFVLGQQFGGTTFDTVTDYNVAADQVQLSLAAFSGLSAGALAGTAFTTGATATTAAHRIIYDNATGNLSFDADGNGAGASSIFANIGTGLAMTATEFLVV